MRNAYQSVRKMDASRDLTVLYVLTSPLVLRELYLGSSLSVLSFSP